MAIESEFPARWAASIRGATAGTVAALVGSEFDTYLRILHPAYLEREGRRQAVRWSEIAAGLRRDVDLRDASFRDLLTPEPLRSDALFNVEPSEGGDRETILEVVSLLRFHTQHPNRVQFGLWDGYSVPGLLGRSRFALPHRSYVRFSGPIVLALDPTGHNTPANLWWPVEESWLLACDVDQPTSYLGASPRIAEVVVASQQLEAVVVDATTRFRPQGSASGTN